MRLTFSSRVDSCEGPPRSLPDDVPEMRLTFSTRVDACEDLDELPGVGLLLPGRLVRELRRQRVQ